MAAAGHIFSWDQQDSPPDTYDEKYIILECGSEVHFVTMAEAYHSDIFAQYTYRSNTKVPYDKVKGGGIVTIDSKNKTIKTYGRSGGFGPPNPEQVKACLENTMGKKGFSIEVAVTNYIRG